MRSRNNRKKFCIDWDDITPDFVTFGKTLTSGYIPLSIVITKKKYLQKIKEKFGNILLPSSTYQGHSLGVVAAIETQKIVNNLNFLKKIIQKGDYLRENIFNELNNLDFFFNVRGRGMRNSLEFRSNNNDLFAKKIQLHALKKYNLIVNSRWHRVVMSPALNISYKDLDVIIENFIKTFKFVHSNWPKFKKEK